MATDKSIVQKMNSAFKGQGVKGVSKKINGYLSENIYYKKHIWNERDLSLPFTIHPPKIKCTFGFDSTEDVNAWIDKKIYHGNPRIDELYERKIASENNHFIFFLKLNDNIIGYRKIGIKNVYIKNFYKAFELKDGIAFTYSFYVDPQYRRYGLGKYLHLKSMEILKNNGIKKITSHIRSDNIPALKIVRDLNYSQTGTSWQFKFFKFNFYSKFPSEIFVI